VFENCHRLDADCRDVDCGENSEVDTDTDEEDDAIENDIENLLLREHIRGGNGLIKLDTTVLDHDVSTEAHESQNITKPQTQSTSSVTPARRVSFADERAPDMNEDSDSDSSVESLRIEFQHTPTEIEAHGSTRSDKHPIQTPADIHKYMKLLMAKDGVPKSILKNKSNDLANRGDTGPHQIQWLHQPDSIPIINQETEEPLWNTAELRLGEELEERPVVITLNNVSSDSVMFHFRSLWRSPRVTRQHRQTEMLSSVAHFTVFFSMKISFC
jgi:hypothetical protein